VVTGERGEVRVIKRECLKEEMEEKIGIYDKPTNTITAKMSGQRKKRMKEFKTEEEGGGGSL
jgi:hypothetical protein